jgi:hypothetical protein
VFPPESQSSTPCCDGILPVIIDARAGEHTGDAQKKFSQRTPRAASLSKFGVRISLLPEQPIAHAPWSSVKINTTFGFFGSRLANLPISLVTFLLK